nr:NADH dehydrogenase [ubiquinone] iron-sulfur protein 2 [Tanacetum cinerariifolium]GEZ32378.1 NADH dehydrogenase [ubiquinone] iron-sulfur protein 2 [Tanacetum cinerariifolium]
MKDEAKNVPHLRGQKLSRQAKVRGKSKVGLISADEEAGARKPRISFLSFYLRGKEKRFATEKANGQREGSRLSRTLAKLDSHSEALRVSEAL